MNNGRVARALLPPLLLGKKAAVIRGRRDESHGDPDADGVGRARQTGYLLPDAPCALRRATMTP